MNDVVILVRSYENTLVSNWGQSFHLFGVESSSNIKKSSYKDKNIRSASRDWAERNLEGKKYLSCLSKDLTTWNWLPMPLLIWRQESEMTPIDVQNSSLIETKINSWQEL